MTKLTKRQQEILNLIQTHMAATGSPPTRAEIAKTMGFRSPNAAEDHLRALARKGVIELVPGTSRGIRLAKSAGGLPIVKSVGLSSGPLLSENHIVGNCKLDRAFFHAATDYLLHLTHKSIPELDILEGDYLAVHQTQEVEIGQIVVSISNQDIQIQRYNHEFSQGQSTIEGSVVGIIRSLNKSPLTAL